MSKEDTITSQREYEWDGERIKQVTKVSDIKLTPKQILDGLDHVRGELNKIDSQENTLVKQLEIIRQTRIDMKKHESEIKQFEVKCEELQLNKLKLYIAEVTSELTAKAKEESDKVISQAGESMSEAQKEKQPYLLFQHMLGTHPKIAQNISKRIITQHLFEAPIFKNPFN